MNPAGSANLKSYYKILSLKLKTRTLFSCIQTIPTFWKPAPYNQLFATWFEFLFVIIWAIFCLESMVVNYKSRVHRNFLHYCDLRKLLFLTIDTFSMSPFFILFCVIFFLCYFFRLYICHASLCRSRYPFIWSFPF